jgi:hypothetical protein
LEKSTPKDLWKSGIGIKLSSCSQKTFGAVENAFGDNRRRPTPGFLHEGSQDEIHQERSRITMSEKIPTNRSDYVAPHETDVDRSLVLLSHDDIANLAHALWEDRGGGDGRAEEDWLEAERLLSKQPA